MKKFFLMSIFGIWATTTKVLGACYDTLPKGIDMFVFKQVMTSKITSKYDSNNTNESLSLKENFTSNKLENISNVIKSYFDELKAISPDAYNKFTLGEFKAEAYAEVMAQGLGLAHGLTNHLTIYASIPIYHIKTNVTFRQTRASNLSAIKNALANIPPNSTTATFVRQLTFQLPETNEQLLQSLVVNFYGYKALGKWEKDAFGDAEIGAIYRLTDNSDKGLAIAAGTILPTGDADDADSLQDVPTGDGQFDVFLESMAGINFLKNTLQFDFKTRFTYQAATTKVLRKIDDSNLPLSRNKITVNEKLGDKLDYTFSITINPTTWLNFNTSFIYNQMFTSNYDVQESSVKNTLENNTATLSQWGKIGVGFSSIQMYKSQKMEIPFDLNLSAQKLLNAKNSAKYNRYDLDFKLYF